MKKFIAINPSVLPTKLRSAIFQFYFESVFPFLDFIEWTIDNYSSSQRVIMDYQGSKVLCQVNSQTVRKALSIPVSHDDLDEKFSKLSSLSLVAELVQDKLHLFLSKMVNKK